MRFQLTLLLILSVSIISCSSSSPVQEEISELPQAKPQAPPQPEKKDIWAWEYGDSDKGPKNWATLNPQYEMCGSGQSQSPVNLVWHKPSSPNPLKINYTEGNATIMNAGYTVRVELTPQSSINYNGVDYLLEKIEIRSPSEHHLSGNELPMEMQFYHRSSNGLKQAIISLFVIKGRGEAWFDDLWAKVQAVQNFKSSAPFRFNPEKMFPPRQTYYHYEGSLTHPPCLEGVQWFVFNTPVQLSQAQIDSFREGFKSNNRPLQPLNNRSITNY